MPDKSEPRPDAEFSSWINTLHDARSFRERHWHGTFEEYLSIVKSNPKVCRNAFQRIYDMILSQGSTEYFDAKKRIIHYHFFDDKEHGGHDAIFGLDIPLMKLANVFKSAARGYGTEQRVILLHGPVGSSKSTIARLLKRGLESYTARSEGALYTFSWVLPARIGTWDVPDHEREVPCPMHEEPLHVIPPEMRAKVLDRINEGVAEEDRIEVRGTLCPACRMYYADLLEHYDGSWEKVAGHIKVRRMILSEKDRVGIGTFQPKDEKNQDSTELTGDINYRKIAEYGSESDPRAFNFDGEFNIANRGLIEFIEVLKLDVAFLYDLLGASQEHKIKPNKFPQTDIDEVILGHTNEPEYRRLQNNEYMEALRDRTVKIDVPYITRLTEEIKIYEKDYSSNKVKGKHMAPHTLEMAAMWAVLTRLDHLARRISPSSRS